MGSNVKKIYWIKWLDACSHHGWDAEEVHVKHTTKGAICQSIGFVLAETDLGITILQSLGYGDKEEVDGSLFIPKGMVIKREYLGTSEE